MVRLDEFERELETCEMADDFVRVIGDFIESVEDPTLRALLLLELSLISVDGSRKRQI
ncbi:MAG: hypothetical protein WAU81_15980 [Candidatus Aminicenantales bacterium]